MGSPPPQVDGSLLNCSDTVCRSFAALRHEVLFWMPVCFWRVTTIVDLWLVDPLLRKHGLGSVRRLPLTVLFPNSGEFLTTWMSAFGSWEARQCHCCLPFLTGDMHLRYPFMCIRQHILKPSAHLLKLFSPQFFLPKFPNQIFEGNVGAAPILGKE